MSTVKVSITLACKNYFSYRAISGELNNDIEWGRVGEGWWCWRSLTCWLGLWR